MSPSHKRQRVETNISDSECYGCHHSHPYHENAKAALEDSKKLEQEIKTKGFIEIE
jgi:hypothetical protein